MKNLVIIAIVVILLVLGFVFWGGQGNKVEAPVTDSGQNATVTPVSPTPTTGVDVSVGAYVSPVKEFTISGKNFSFTPSTITVKKGDKVKITFNNTSGFHDFKIDAYGVATPQKASPDIEIIEFTADKVGSFEYYCSVGQHRQMGMKGTLIVQ